MISPAQLLAHANAVSGACDIYHLKCVRQCSGKRCVCSIYIYKSSYHSEHCALLYHSEHCALYLIIHNLFQEMLLVRICSLHLCLHFIFKFASEKYYHLHHDARSALLNHWHLEQFFHYPILLLSISCRVFHFHDAVLMKAIAPLQYLINTSQGFFTGMPSRKGEVILYLHTNHS